MQRQDDDSELSLQRWLLLCTLMSQASASVSESNASLPSAATLAQHVHLLNGFIAAHVKLLYSRVILAVCDSACPAVNRKVEDPVCVHDTHVLSALRAAVTEEVMP